MDIFLVNQDHPAAKSLIEKLAKQSKPGAIIPLTAEEMELSYSSSFRQVSCDIEAGSARRFGDDAFNAVVEYILDHKDDIEIGINDFGTLKPVLDWFSRNS